jgi:hypothetical protein
MPVLMLMLMLMLMFMFMLMLALVRGGDLIPRAPWRSSPRPPVKADADTDEA